MLVRRPYQADIRQDDLVVFLYVGLLACASGVTAPHEDPAFHLTANPLLFPEEVDPPPPDRMEAVLTGGLRQPPLNNLFQKFFL